MTLSRRHFFYGSLLAGAVPAGGFGSTPSLKSAGYKSPNEKLNFAAIDRDLRSAMGLGVIGVFPRKTKLGAPAADWKEWDFRGLEVLVEIFGQRHHFFESGRRLLSR